MTERNRNELKIPKEIPRMGFCSRRIRYSSISLAMIVMSSRSDVNLWMVVVRETALMPLTTPAAHAMPPGTFPAKKKIDTAQTAVEAAPSMGLVVGNFHYHKNYSEKYYNKTVHYQNK